MEDKNPDEVQITDRGWFKIVCGEGAEVIDESIGNGTEILKCIHGHYVKITD